jgi:hypothetical protein
VTGLARSDMVHFRGREVLSVKAMSRQLTKRFRICRGLSADRIAGHCGYDVPLSSVPSPVILTWSGVRVLMRHGRVAASGASIET